MYFNDSKIELSYLAHLSCCVVSKAIQDYRRSTKKQPVDDYFMFVRKQIDEAHAQNALDWFYDQNDSALSFPVCCFLIERSLANKAVIAKALRHKKDGLLFDPELLRGRIFEDPSGMLRIFKELSRKLGQEDVRGDDIMFDVDETPEAFIRNNEENVVPIDLLAFEDTGCDSEEPRIAAVG